jgi:anti-sigma factor RsiW
MDNQEAQFILRAYRANGADANDPAFLAALEQAKRDPSLARWLAQEQALDAAISRKLNAVMPPTGLRENILAGAKASRPTRSAWLNSPMIYALAACLMVAVGLSIVLPKYRDAQARRDFAQLVIDDAVHEQHTARAIEASAALRSYISNTSTHLASGDMPVAREQMMNLGCRTITLGGRPVAEVCFARSGYVFHLYITPRMKDLDTQPKFFEHDGGAAAGWSDATNSYVVATTSGVEALRQIL